MKKFISTLLVLAIVISCISMVTFATGSTTAPESNLGGATVITTAREYRTSSPSQNVTDKLKAAGLGTYYYYAYVRLMETPDKPITISLGLECTYTKSDSSTSRAWPQTGHKSTQAISDNEWHLIGGTFTMAESKYGTADSITNAVSFAETLYQGTSGDAGAYLGDIEWDGLVLYKENTDGTFGENLFVNPDMNIDSTGATGGWGKNQRFVMSNSLVPQNDENALHVEDRSTNTSGPSQNLTGRLEKGTYLYSGYVRLTETPETAKKVSFGIELTNGGAGVGWPAVSTQISDTQWHKISGTVEISKDFDKAVTFVNTAEASGEGADIEIDGLFLAKQDENGFFGENIILNPTMEYDEETGETPEWGLYRVATVTNTGFNTTEEPETPVDPEVPIDPVENPDGSITYPDGKVPVTDKNIVYSGRFYDVDGGKQAAFESYVEIKFTGNKISSTSGSKGNVYYELDGVINYDVINLANLKLTNIGSGTHTLRIYANAQASRFTLNGVVIDKNEKTLPITQVKKIEFIGDSITEGYVDPSDKAENIANNSYLNSYALKAGRMLNEEFGWSFNTVAFGGIGLVRVNNGDPLTMGERYFLQREYIKSTDGTTRESALAAAGTYDKNYVPDYIVINLGTNDGSLSSQDFFENYVDFIKDLKEAYPNVVIFCMTPFNGAKEYYIKRVAEEFKKDVYAIDSAQWGIKEGKDVHPAPASLDEAAEKLFNVLSEYEEKGTLPKTKALNAKQISITSDMQYAFAYFRSTDLGLSTDMADENGYITRSYTIQNVGEYDAKIRVLWQHDWTDIKNSSAVTKTVKVGESQEITIKLQIDENGQVEDTAGVKADLDAVTFRVEFSNGLTSGDTVCAGTSCIIKPNDPYDFTIAEINQGTVYKNTNIAESKGTCAYKGVNDVVTESIIGATLDIGSSLTVSYYAQLWDNLDATLKVTRNGSTVELTGAYDEETGYYVYQYKGINPQCMTDNLYAELVAGGEVIDVKEEYSVKTYAENQAAKTAKELELTEEKYNELITLLSDMLVYGKNSQDYMKYNLDNYATDGITWLNASEFVTPANIVKNVIKNDANNKITGAGVRVENVNKIYFTVNITDANAEVYVDGEKAEIVENKVYTKDIKATGFDAIHTAEVKVNGEVVSKVEYNVNAYINSKNTNSSVGTLVKALNNYGASAVAYSK